MNPETFWGVGPTIGAHPESRAHDICIACWDTPENAVLAVNCAVHDEAGVKRDV